MASRKDPFPDIILPRQLAQLYNVNVMTTRHWVAAGMPKHMAGPMKPYFLLSEVIPWHESYTLSNQRPTNVRGSKTDAQTRKITAEAERSEIKLRRERGEFGSVHESKAVMDQFVGNARSAVLSLPTKAGGRLPAPIRLQVKPILEEIVREILTDMSTTVGKVNIPEEEDEQQSVLA